MAHGEHDLYTFCMCAGGWIIPSISEPEMFCTNGMSLSKRDSYYANSGLVVTIPTEAFGGSDILAGVRLQQQYEAKAFAMGRGEYRCPVQRATDFLKNRVSSSVPPTSYPRGGVTVNAFSAPVFDRRGQMLLALSTTCRADQLTPDWDGVVPEALLKAARRLSLRLGHEASAAA